MLMDFNGVPKYFIQIIINQLLKNNTKHRWFSGPMNAYYAIYIIIYIL